MQTITVTKTETGFSVKIPFDIKDNFRDNFKAAKWNATKKTWDVGPRSKAKLEQWVAIAQGKLPTDDEIQDYDERVMIQAEIEKLEESAAQVKRQFESEAKSLASAKELKAMADEARENLSSAKSELDAAKAETAKANADAKQSADEVFALLNGIVDVAAIKAAAVKMSRVMKSVDSNSKRVFSDEQDEVRVMREALKNAGFRCEAIEFIGTANKNRPDRDNPSFVTEKMWLNIWKIDNDE